MRVRALKPGYFNESTVREGQEFEIRERQGMRDGKEVTISEHDQFSKLWMEVVDSTKAPKKKEIESGAREPIAFSKIKNMDVL